MKGRGRLLSPPPSPLLRTPKNVLPVVPSSRGGGGGGEVLTFLRERGILLFARMEYNEKAQTHDARLLWWRGGEGEGDCDRSFVAKWGEATTSLLFVRVDDGQICCAEHGRQRSSSSSSDGLCNGSSGVHLIILSPFRKKTVEGGKEEEEDG